MARRLDRIFTSSTVSARALERDFGVSPQRLRMVANGVDTELFRPDPGVPRDPDLRVKYQLAFTLGELDGTARIGALAALLNAHGDDKWIRVAVSS